MCEELCLKCEMRIRKKTFELKVVCNTYLLCNSTGTDLANLCMLTHSLSQPALVPSLQHSYLLKRIPYSCLGFGVFCVGMLSWYGHSLQSGKRVVSVCRGEIRRYSSLSPHPEFMECSGKSLKAVYIKLYMNCVLSGPVWRTRRDVWLGNVLRIFASLLNNKTLTSWFPTQHNFVLMQVSQQLVEIHACSQLYLQLSDIFLKPGLWFLHHLYCQEGIELEDEAFIFGGLHCVWLTLRLEKKLFLEISCALVQTLKRNAEALSLCRLSDRIYRELIFGCSVAELFYKHFRQYWKRSRSTFLNHFFKMTWKICSPACNICPLKLLLCSCLLLSVWAINFAWV